MDSSARLFLSIIINAAVTTVELVVGVFNGSMLLISDSIHNFGDTLSLGVSYVARLVAGRNASYRYTFGYRRAEVVAAFFNSTLLLVLSILVIVESFSRLLSPRPVSGDIVITMGCVAFIANMLSSLLLREHAERSLNIRSAYLHLLSDALSSLVVIIGALIIRHTGLYIVDPLASLAIMFYIVSETLALIKTSARILMESAPIDLERVRKEISSIPGVINVHHCHAWQLGENDIFIECHVEVKDMLLSKAQMIIDMIEKKLKKLGITHTTIQLESGRCRRKDLIYKKEKD